MKLKGLLAFIKSLNQLPRWALLLFIGEILIFIAIAILIPVLLAQ